MSDNCLSQEKIQEYLEKTLANSEAEKAARHINSCPACRNEVAACEAFLQRATLSARRQVSTTVPPGRLAAIMSQIQINRNSSKSSSREKLANQSTGFIWQLKYILAPAMIAVFLAIGLSWHSPENYPALPEPEKQAFSLAHNTAEMPFSTGPAEVAPGSLKPGTRSIGLGKEIILPEGAMLRVGVDQHKFLFSGPTTFTFEEKVVRVAKGVSSFVLVGDHAGFKVITPDVTVEPLGTSFAVEAKSWGTKITLRTGRLDLISCSGIKRQLQTPDDIYISSTGAFSADMPQPGNSPLPPEAPNQPAPATNDQPAGNSPGKLIDSF
ncbi:MAG TPA: hypothetical protein PLK58_02485 [Candidatus Rifleibacterium sp.]|jgi:hypothetical protein|nr:hypothetical protein [Candidatus Rifleibacterium sp.]HPW57479.1 hypothetical protein [Candidatus Rifleibacterium sp.]